MIRIIFLFLFLKKKKKKRKREKTIGVQCKTEISYLYNPVEIKTQLVYNARQKFHICIIQ